MLGKHVRFWVLAMLAVTLALPLFITPRTMWNAARSELHLLEGGFGTSSAAAITRTATSVYNTIFIETGFVKTIKQGRISAEERDTGEQVWGNTSAAASAATNNYLTTISAMFYIATLRFLILLSWLPFVLPFLAGAVSEGVTRRWIKYATFGQYGAVYYASAMHASTFITALPLMYLLAPFPMTPFFVPFWAVLAAVPIVTALANASQIRPK